MSGWQPTQIESQHQFAVDSRTRPMLVETDAGRAVVKAMENPAGPQALVRELIGTRLARLIGLPVFDFAVIDHDGLVPLVLSDGTAVAPGPLFAARWEEGTPWNGKNQLARIENQDDISRLVVFDCWIQNFDRYTKLGGANRGNVFLSTERAEEGRFRLLAIDHTHCLLGRRVDADHIGGGHVTDPTVYSLFDEFRPFLTAEALQNAADTIKSFRGGQLYTSCGGLPTNWVGSDFNPAPLVDFLTQRAAWIPGFVEQTLFPSPPQQELSFED